MTMLETAPAEVTTDIDVRIVEQARDLFRDDPCAWTRGVVARDKYGHELGTHDIADAEQMCAIGALYKYGLPINWLLNHTASGDWAKEMMANLACISMTLYSKPSVIIVNDDLGREAVVNVFNAYLEWREDSLPGERPPGYENYRDLSF